MTRMAYFQPFSGISGDMTLGALVDAGLEFAELEEALRDLGLEGYALEREKVRRGALQATRIRVLAAEAGGSPATSQARARSPSRDHSHGHGHPHRDPSRGRNLGAILALIDGSRLAAKVKDRAAAVFRRLGEAEARVHGVEIEQVHFHEVGAVDSIVDIVGSSIALDLLGIDEVYSAPIHAGTGWITGSHGRLPLPAPATLELLKGFPVIQVDSGAELTTPTGAAILTTLSKGFGTMPHATILSIGYGAGDDRSGPVPNCLRVILAERSSSGCNQDRVVLLETNVDDMSPEWLGHLTDRLFAAGALDVYITPILMKKSRPAQKVSLLAPLEREGTLAETLFRESTTFGVRRMEMDRLVLERQVFLVETPWGEVRVKVGRWGEEEMSAAPEFEDLRRVAAGAGLPLKEVHRKVMEIYSGTKAPARETQDSPTRNPQDSNSA